MHVSEKLNQDEKEEFCRQGSSTPFVGRWNATLQSFIHSKRRLLCLLAARGHGAKCPALKGLLAGRWTAASLAWMRQAFIYSKRRMLYLLAARGHGARGTGGNVQH
jgi:hypothetical protein